ncbi:MAG: GntR family transcriptional regulator [Rubrobacter sp.]|jgi:DNA-binding transcriptional regulator YhcF (GntR family)|nr:GntR family transcriptional regulator [Rubrobacter sp.]
MDLKINQKSHVPVHVQLREQIKHLILTGNFEVGSRLPSIRALAGFLRVNRNTVARVVTDLEHEGYVESRRGSGVYVMEPPVSREDRRRQEVLERVLDLAAAQNVSVEDLAYELLARAGTRPREKVSILFVECTQNEMDQFSDELESQLPVEVERVLLENLEGRLAEGGELPWRLAVTTFFHVHEVEEMMEPRGIETVALLAEANIESLQKLMELPEGAVVGIVGSSQTCMDNLSRSLEGAGLDHLDLREVYLDQEEAVGELFEEENARAILCSTFTMERLEAMGAPEKIEIIDENRTLDKGGVEMLGQIVRQLPRE